MNIQHNIVVAWKDIQVHIKKMSSLFGASTGPNTTPATSKKWNGGVFGNPITSTIMAIVIGLIGIGMIMALGAPYVTTRVTGVCFVAMGILMIGFGWTKHGFITTENKDKKDEEVKTVSFYGFLTFMNKPIRINGKCVVVDRNVCLAPYFGIKSTLVNMTPENMEFPVSIVSSDPISTTIKIIAVGKPLVDDLSEFVTYGNGNWKRIKNDIGGLISEKIEAVTGTQTIIDMARDGGKVSQPLWEHIESKMPTKLFGIQITQVRAECTVPDSIAKKMEEVLQAKYEAEKLLRMTRGYQKAETEAISLSQEHDGKKITSDEAHQRVVTTVLLEQENIERIDWTFGGNPKNVNVSVGRLEFGGSRQKNQKNS